MPLVFLPVVLALVIARADARADFNGEVLVAPPPPNWSGGMPVPVKDGVRRTWKRTFLISGGGTEQVIVTRLVKQGNAVAKIAAQQLSTTLTADCLKKTVSEFVTGKAQIGTTASFTTQCSSIKDAPAETTLFTMSKIYIGEFNTFSVSRIWRGHREDPGSPANSPRTGEQWAQYFARIAVCNTLTDNCSMAEAEIVHADPRFRTMRALPVSIKPVVPLANLMKAAEGFGDLSGRAEICGEDISPLTLKISRMFEYVAANDQESSKALAAYRSAKARGATDQEKQSKDSCGLVLREFRQHPTRVAAFPRYIERFL
ncbi:MAG: hypothetical protein WD075_08260 [Rhodospirillales bacterium]